MKHIHILPPIKIAQLDGTPVCNENGEQVEHTFQDYAMARLIDPGMGEDMEAVLLVLKLRDSLQKAIADGESAWPVEDADHKVLVAVTKSPKRGYNPDVAHCLVPYMKAIVEA